MLMGISIQANTQSIDVNQLSLASKMGEERSLSRAVCSLYDLDAYEIGNENLSPENSFETDLSMHYHGEILSFDLAGFYNQIDDYIFISPTTETAPDGVDIYRFSQTNAILYGGEAGIHFH